MRKLWFGGADAVIEYSYNALVLADTVALSRPRSLSLVGTDSSAVILQDTHGVKEGTAVMRLESSGALARSFENAKAGRPAATQRVLHSARGVRVFRHTPCLIRRRRIAPSRGKKS